MNARQTLRLWGCILLACSLALFSLVGGGDGLGHGVYATAALRLVVTSFMIE